MQLNKYHFALIVSFFSCSRIFLASIFVSSMESHHSSHLISYRIFHVSMYICRAFAIYFQRLNFYATKIAQKKAHFSSHQAFYVYYCLFRTFFSLSSSLYFIETCRRTQTIELTPMLDITNYLWMHR